MPPKHHKEIALFLRDSFEGDASVANYRDNNDARPIPIAQCGLFSSTIGVSDVPLNLPEGEFELAAFGTKSWLANTLASSVYWLDGREFNEWPLVCEDVVRHNVNSTYRHMAFIPSELKLILSTGKEVRWLVGIPILDSDIGISKADVLSRAKKVYPDWVFE